MKSNKPRVPQTTFESLNTLKSREFDPTEFEGMSEAEALSAVGADPNSARYRSLAGRLRATPPSRRAVDEALSSES